MRNYYGKRTGRPALLVSDWDVIGWVAKGGVEISLFLGADSSGNCSIEVN